MEALFELIGALFGELYVDIVMSLIPKKKLKMSTETFLTVLCGLVFVATFFLILIGANMLIEPEHFNDVSNGTIMLSVGIAVVVLHIAIFVINLCVKNRRVKKLKSIIGKPVHVVVERKLGTAHPEHPNMIYDVNYGYIPGITGGDGEEQDAYVLGVEEPIDAFDGVVVAVIHRLNDNEDKWVVAPRGAKIGIRMIRKKTYFTEQYFNSDIIK